MKEAKRLIVTGNQDKERPARTKSSVFSIFEVNLMMVAMMIPEERKVAKINQSYHSNAIFLFLKSVDIF